MGCVDDPSGNSGQIEEKEEQLISEILLERDDMGITIAAAQKTYIWDVMSTYGTYTFFAPTNDAWASFFERKGISGIDELDTTFINAIFEYHILPVEKKTLNFLNGLMEESDTTVNGDLLYMDLTKGLDNIRVNNKALIQEGNFEAWNGILHIVDYVLDPPVFSVAEFLEQEPDFSQFYQFLSENGITDTLKRLSMSFYPFTKNEFTVMAVPNQFMADVIRNADSLKLLDEAYDELLSINPSHSSQVLPNQLQQYAASFVVSGTEYTPNMLSSYKPTLGHVPYGDSTIRLKVKVLDESILLNDQAELDLSNSDLIMKNGVIHRCNSSFIFLDKSPRDIVYSAYDHTRWNTAGKGKVETSSVQGYLGDDVYGQVRLEPNGAGDRFWIDIPNVPAGDYQLTMICKKQGSMAKIYANNEPLIFGSTDENGIYDFSFLLGNRGRVDIGDERPTSTGSLFLYEVPTSNFKVTEEQGKATIMIEVVIKSTQSPDFQFSAFVLKPAVL